MFILSMISMLLGVFSISIPLYIIIKQVKKAGVYTVFFSLSSCLVAILAQMAYRNYLMQIGHIDALLVFSPSGLTFATFLAIISLFANAYVVFGMKDA